MGKQNEETHMNIFCCFLLIWASGMKKHIWIFSAVFCLYGQAKWRNTYEYFLLFSAYMGKQNEETHMKMFCWVEMGLSIPEITNTLDCQQNESMEHHYIIGLWKWSTYDAVCECNHSHAVIGPRVHINVMSCIIRTQLFRKLNCKYNQCSIAKNF